MAIESKIPSGYAEIVETYGDPAGHNGNVSPAWEEAHIVEFFPPYPFLYVDSGAVSRVTRFRVHKLVVPDLTRILENVMAEARKLVKANDGDGHTTAYYDARVMQVLAEHRVNVFSGSFCYRNKRGQDVPSDHAFGIALDFDAEHNAFGQERGTLPEWFIKSFTDAGWEWGGQWSGADKDWMHFQRAQKY